MVLKGDYKNMINNERLSGHFASPDFSAFPLRDWGSWRWSICLYRFSGTGRSASLAGTATDPHRFRRLSVPEFFCFCRSASSHWSKTLIRLGLIGGWELTGCPIADPSHVDYGQVIPWKEKVLALAYSRFPQKRHEIPGIDQSFQEFCESSRYWLGWLCFVYGM